MCNRWRWSSLRWGSLEIIFESGQVLCHVGNHDSGAIVCVGNVVDVLCNLPYGFLDCISFLVCSLFLFLGVGENRAKHFFFDGNRHSETGCDGVSSFCLINLGLVVNLFDGFV